MDALLLDYNGVVVDDEPLHYRSFQGVLAGEGIRLDEPTYYADYLGFDDRAAFREAFRRDGRPLEPSAIGRLVARKARAYADLAERQLSIVPGVAAFARAAGALFRLAVVSGALRREIESGLALAGIAHLVDAVISAEDVTVTKPDPAGYRAGLAALASLHGTADWRAVVIEDSLPGLAAARALGAGCLMLATSHSLDRLRGAGADLVWESFEGRQPSELGALLRPVAVPAPSGLPPRAAAPPAP